MKRLAWLPVIGLGFLFLSITCVYAAELYNGSVHFDENEIKIPFYVDTAEKLAGAKLSFSYDSDVLEYREVTKSEKTQKLMLVVNDKAPGKLIVVLAGARGINGEDVHLVTLGFSFKGSCHLETSMKLTAAELMNETPEKLLCTVRDKIVMVSLESVDGKK